jgi:hypothetical protein
MPLRAGDDQSNRDTLAVAGARSGYGGQNENRFSFGPPGLDT